jgi:hypothetical protein
MEENAAVAGIYQKDLPHLIPGREKLLLQRRVLEDCRPSLGGMRGQKGPQMRRGVTHPEPELFLQYLMHLLVYPLPHLDLEVLKSRGKVPLEAVGEKLQGQDDAKRRQKTGQQTQKQDAAPEGGPAPQNPPVVVASPHDLFAIHGSAGHASLVRR